MLHFFIDRVLQIAYISGAFIDNQHVFSVKFAKWNVEMAHSLVKKVVKPIAGESFYSTFFIQTVLQYRQTT